MYNKDSVTHTFCSVFVRLSPRAREKRHMTRENVAAANAAFRFFSRLSGVEELLVTANTINIKFSSVQGQIVPGWRTGRHLSPRLVQKATESKTSYALGWKVKVRIKNKMKRAKCYTNNSCWLTCNTPCYAPSFTVWLGHARCGPALSTALSSKNVQGGTAGHG